MYLIKDNKCYFSDNIVCETPDCENCDTYINRKLKKVFKHYDGVQLNLFDFIDEKRKEYVRQHNRKRNH